MSIVNVYGQANDGHDTVYIMGDREGLEALRAAIDAALADRLGFTARSGLFTSCGEGYQAIALRVDDEDRLGSLMGPFSYACTDGTIYPDEMLTIGDWERIGKAGGRARK